VAEGGADPQAITISPPAGWQAWRSGSVAIVMACGTAWADPSHSSTTAPGSAELGRERGQLLNALVGEWRRSARRPTSGARLHT
jgi:hypothetical protein